MGLGGVTVRLSGMADAQTATDNSGQFAFTGLRAGTYSVEISGFDGDELGFGSVSSSATVGVGGTKIISFDGTYLRTAGIMGQVSVEGVGLPNVTVTMTGEGEDKTDVTDAGGLYGFSKLKAGTYTVAISGYDPDEVEFTKTSKSVTIATGEPANIPFEGTLLRTSGISGRVSVEGMGIPNVTVTLAGAADTTYTTMDDGQYAFAGLAEGTYVVSMMNPDETAYAFEKMSHTVALGDAESAIRNFDGTHTRTASISGVLFIDEVMPDKMLTTGEPSITAALAPLVAHGLLDEAMLAGLLANAKVIVRGPNLNDPPREAQIQLDGSFTVGELVTGSYQVELPVNNEMVAAALDAAGVRFTGESALRHIAAGETGTANSTVNFPFSITMQTIGVGAVMGSAEELSDPLAPVAGVTLALFPTAQDAEAETNELGKLPMPTMTDEMTGRAAFHFARDADTSPGSDDTDNIVFVKVVDAGDDDLMVSDREVIEVQYPGVARVHDAPTTVRFQNVAVNFQFWIKNDANARGGDVLVDGWHTQVFMGEVTDESMPLMMPDPEDPEDDMKMVNLTMPSETSEDEDGDGMPDGVTGRVMVSYPVTTDQLPATFSVALRPDNTDATDDIEDWQQPQAMGETWNQVGDNLTYTHTGFELPDDNTHEENDLNLKLGQDPARVTFTTQKLTVGVYREADDVAGFSDFQSRVSAGDHRPAADVAKELSVSVMVEASGRRGLEVFDDWDHDDDDGAVTPAIDATLPLAGGMATFANLPAEMDFTVQFNEGSDRVAVGGPDSRSDRVQTYGADVELGMSTGAFGDMSGAGPEVELCPLTTDTRPSSLEDDEASDCATFAYQWTTGSISGDVGRAVEDLDVSIDADTDEHSEAPRDTETDMKGEFSWSGVQDGVYSIAVTSSEDYTIKEKSVRVDVYHNEFKDDKNDKTEYVGTADTDHADFTATKLRLSIKGYAANVSHENNDVVRGDETYAGAELELYAWKNNAATKIDKTGPLVQTATVDENGLYEFKDLDEGNYVIVAKNTDDYEMFADGPDVHYLNKIMADTYKDDDVLEQALKLPKWDYEASNVLNMISKHTVGIGPAAETFTYYNFALLHGDGEFSGRVFEARGEPGGIAVELRRCETYTAADGTTDPVTAERCREDKNFGAQTEDAGSKGRWDFPSLREGYYVANIAATTYNRAKWGDDGIDDDAANCDGDDDADEMCDEIRTTDMYGMLEGNRAFNRGGVTYYVYNRTLDDDATEVGTEIKVEGTTNVDAGEVTLGTLSIGAVTEPTGTGTLTDAVTTWATRSIKITPDIPARATFTAKVTTGDAAATPSTLKTISTGSGEDGDDVTLALKANATSTATGAVPGDALENTVEVTVTAENGYDDFVYSFTVSAANPVDARLAGVGGLAFGLTRGTGTGGDGFVFDPADDEQRVTVPPGTAVTGTTMSLFIRVIGKALQEGIEVMHNGTELDALDRLNSQVALASDYRITIPKTGDLQGHVVNITVTSEDGKDFNYEMSLRRN